MKLNKQAVFALAAVVATTAWAKIYDVRDFGAVGDGVTKNTKAIQSAIDAANAAGGGTVEFGPGTYVTGSIYLKSHIDFHLGSGATLLGSPDREDYCKLEDFPQNSSYANESTFGAHLVICLEQEDVTIRGPGRIDGNVEKFLINPKTGHGWGWQPGKPQWYGQDMIPFRPSQMLHLVESKNLRIQDLELSNSTYWNLFIWGCEQVQVTGCWIHNERDKFHTHNGDGIDIDCSRYVTVSDCRIRTADDCITLRASGKKLKKPGDCAYITIANCTLSTPCNCVRAGVGNGKVHDAVFSNIVVHDARTAINFVSSWDPQAPDGVDFRNIRFMNWTVDCKNLFHLYGGPLAEGVTRSAKMREIYFNGFSGVATADSRINGCSPESPIENIYFRDIDIETKVITSNLKGVSVEGGKLKFEPKGRLVSSFGYDAKDSTEFIQKALDSGEPKIILDGREWVTRPLFIRRSDFEFVLANGARLVAKRGEFKGRNDCLLTIASGCHDVTVRGEGKAELKMWTEDYDDPKQYSIGEWRHGIAIRSATNVVVRNLTSHHTGGDGFYVLGAKNLLFEDLVADDNYRLGLGLISAEDMTVRNCVFSHSTGTAPKCGIDCEPNTAQQHLVNILFDRCRFEHNDSAGALMHLNQFSDKTEPVSITFRDCISSDNKGTGYQLSAADEKGAVAGNVVFERCRSKDNRGDFSHYNQTPNGVKTAFVDTDFKSVRTTTYEKPVGAAPLYFDKIQPLTTTNPEKPVATGWLRGNATFMQYVPSAGTYPIRFKTRKVGAKDGNAEVQLRDRAGTDLGTFKVPEGGMVYELKSRGSNFYRFEISVRAGAVEVESQFAGAALRADRFLHLFAGQNKAYSFSVPAGTKEVSISVRPEEACSAELLDASGKVVDKMPHGTNSWTLKAAHADAAKDEVWQVRVVNADEDMRVKIGAPCEPVLYL